MGKRRLAFQKTKWHFNSEPDEQVERSLIFLHPFFTPLHRKGPPPPSVFLQQNSEILKERQRVLLLKPSILTIFIWKNTLQTSQLRKWRSSLSELLSLGVFNFKRLFYFQVLFCFLLYIIVIFNTNNYASQNIQISYQENKQLH